MKNLILAWDRFGAFLCRLFGRNHLCECGHKSKYKTCIEAEGRSGVYILHDKEYCAECFRQAFIKCAWCGKIIIPDEPVTLNAPIKKDFKIPAHAVIYKNDPLQLVGCLRFGCGDYTDMSGFWIMPGKVKREAPPLEMCL